MGIGVRVYLVNDDDSLKRLPLTRFERLFQGDPEEKLTEYPGKRVRYVFAAVDMVDRKPVEILRVEFNYMALDSEGRLDERELHDSLKTGVEMIWAPMDAEGQDKVVEARHLFVRRWYKAKYNWEPTTQVKEAVFRAIFRI